MDKNEQKQKIEELKEAIRDKDFNKAVEVADTLEVKKIKDNNLLYLMADAYEHNKDYASAKKVLLVAYDHTTTGRHIAYRLCLLSIKMKDFAEARDYYEDFLEMAPRDTARYVLKYKMAEAQEKPIEDLITILEEYVNLDMEEKWAYELAKLYHVVGNKEKCIDICDEISLWFADGKYVSKAMDLKKMYSPLTPAQQEKYDEKKRKVMEEAEKAKRKAIELKPFEVNINMITDIPEVKIEPEITDEKMQAVVADGMKEIFAENEEELLEEEAVKLENESDVEDLGETKIFGNTNGGMEEILFQPKENEEILNKEIEKEQEDSIQEEVVEDKEMQEIEEVEKIEEMVEDEEVKTVSQPDAKKEEVFDSVEPIQDISGVADILRQLQERGILKAETVEQAVNIIDEAGFAREELEETKEKLKETVAENSEVSIDETEFEETVATRDNKNIVDDEVGIDKEEISENTSEKSEEENQIKEEEFALEEETMHTEQFEIPKEVSKEDIPEEDVSKEEVPVFDLSFEVPERDESEDIGKSDMVETIAAESDLGFRTNTPSAKVEIISGAGIVEEGEFEEAESVEEIVEQPVLKEDNDNTESEQMDETEVILEKTKSLEVLSEEKEKASETVEPEIESEEKASETEEEISVEPEIVLTEEELTAFKNYLNVEGFESNIREVLQELIVNYNPNGKSSEGNVVIMGSEKTGKTTLAIEIIKLVNNKRGRRNRKLAKVNATALNRRGFRNALNKLLGSDLIIENAEQLGIMTLSEIIDVSGMFTDDMLIILEGETEGMTKLLEDSSRATQVFNHVITIREYDIKEWVEYGKRYANTKGYSLDEVANLAFYKAIDDFFGANKGIGKNDVETIIDDAIAKSRRIGRKLTGIFSSKKDDEGLNILVESDFNI